MVTQSRPPIIARLVIIALSSVTIGMSLAHATLDPSSFWSMLGMAAPMVLVVFLMGWQIVKGR
jgi:hypothetical protein